MILNKYILVITSLLAVNNASAKMVEYIEDAYLTQASDEITKIVNNIAEQQNFNENYEITSPKKAGIQINPWNNLVSSAKNPTTGNLIFIINPEFFSQLNKDEQNFLINRGYIFATTGGTSIPFKIAPWIFMILSISMITCLTILLGKFHTLSHLNKWVKLLMALCIMVVLNLAIFNKLQLKTLDYLANNINININNEAIKKTGISKETAIDVLTKFDNTVKTNLKNGDVFWKPFETSFEKQIQALKK